MNSQRPGGICTRRPLWKIPRNTLVRSLDRLKADDWIEEWLEDMEDLWQRLPHWGNDTCSRADSLDEALNKDLVGKLVFKFLSGLPDNEADLKTLLTELVFSPVPVWLWAYNCPTDAEAFSIAIDQLLSAQNLTDSATFAKAIRDQREILPDLGVLCDCPTRLPILVNWKKSPLRQPAAVPSLSA